ncbi:DeoR/GlpR family DNA-binding transcription regulator [Mesorhizobium sp.]|uniref:DeoR/GlpR family DNA-binding transcription regulator n=1 Tax=Mesorhizobium sp. TaxID=1871066 RepID=UPI000FE406B1|nr:DeoR/GlpR family DNA-binding transcription regulator [Mesorhizobium sp.]RWA70769.1 MAG: DeoR/GlpR transcriptional regulator [Mesorhizobium sp.]RWC03227.1 MAG: DeoR/GlpR transcriptional regulator [Mesorhizobium sp.]RWG77138.1 MAG: DeoR/GlpR transcriptional regulator [Mesorhizobium sp.]RWG78145.1 MAG: DeoR/GlpR transcriptional regulator [Mesorhizobium sp.]RWJ97562.1 MAG: DeoR/GlpR transcriptional regulator [Mesorhizobium sp.]
MLTEERHQFIRDRLAADGKVLAGELASRFGVSEDTVRRDLRELAKAGQLRRVYGGAVPAAPFAAATISQRSSHAVEEKHRLAKAAVRVLASGQALFIDGGSTNEAIARAIPRDIELTVATNSLGVASALADLPLVELIVLGGRYIRDLGTCVGGDTLAAVAQLGADLFFLGSCGLDASRGVTAFDSAEAEVKRAMAKNSAGIVIAATNDKLATAAPYRVAAADRIRHLVVERTAPAAILADFQRQGAEIRFA